MRQTIERTLAGLSAGIGWAGLALQFWLIVTVMGLAEGSWRFLAFFTILANIGAALVATAVATGNSGVLARPKAKFVAATSIVLVGLVYSLWLRTTWDPQGLQKLADIALHDVVPVLFVGMWLAGLHEQLKWRDIGWALVPPALLREFYLSAESAYICPSVVSQMLATAFLTRFDIPAGHLGTDEGHDRRAVREGHEACTAAVAGPQEND